MKRLYVLFLMGLLTLPVLADTIGYTGFEDSSPLYSSKYTGRYSAPQYLVNVDGAGQLVDYAGGAELGHKIWYNGTDGPVNQADMDSTYPYDYIGPADFHARTGDGCMQIDDSDPELTVEIAEVDLTGYNNVIVSFFFKIRAGNSSQDGYFEADDFVKVDLEYTDDQANDYTVTVVDLAGDAANDFYALNGYNWIGYSQAVPNNAVSAQLKMTVHVDDYQEGAYLDDVYFTGTTGSTTFTTVDYGWEDGSDVLGVFNNIVVANDAVETHDASAGSLYMERGVDSTPQTYLAEIQNLRLGDVVNVSLWAKTGQYSGFQDGSISLAANFIDVNGDYVAYAGELTTYSGNDWTEISGAFGMSNADATGIMIVAKVYNESGDSGWVDDISITYPDYATNPITVAFPSSSISYPATKTSSYGWEDLGVVLDDFFWPIVNNVFTEARTGTRSLKITKDFGVSSTPYGYVAFIDGLVDGDVVRASFYGKDGRYTGFDPDDGSIRLWAHYTDVPGEPNSFGGSAGGNEMYSSNDWTELSGMWVFDEGDTSQFDPRTGMIIEARVYSESGDYGFVDDLVIEVPDFPRVSVDFPDPCALPICTNPFSDFDGDCETKLNDLQEFIGQYGSDGIGSFIDPGYLYRGYDWFDPNGVAIDAEWNEPVVAVVSTDAPDGKSLEIEMGTTFSGAAEVRVANATGIQDGDEIHVAVTWKSGSDPNSYLSLGGYMIRDNAYKGSKFELDEIVSTSDGWTTASARMYFDIGDPPREGIGIVVYGHGDPGMVAGYVDKVVVSAPYYEDNGSPLTVIEFPSLDPLGIDVNEGYLVTNPAEFPLACVNRPQADINQDCYVTLGDYIFVADEWLGCGWDVESNCSF